MANPVLQTERTVINSDHRYSSLPGATARDHRYLSIGTAATPHDVAASHDCETMIANYHSCAIVRTCDRATIKACYVVTTASDNGHVS